MTRTKSLIQVYRKTESRALKVKERQPFEHSHGITSSLLSPPIQPFMAIFFTPCLHPANHARKSNRATYTRFCFCSAFQEILFPSGSSRLLLTCAWRWNRAGNKITRWPQFILFFFLISWNYYFQYLDDHWICQYTLLIIYSIPKSGAGRDTQRQTQNQTQ